jgi:manganese transport protein
LVTAAFIGPGTVMTASVAGARHGFALLWALAFAVAAAIVLQEMAARLGLVTRQGLGEALRSTFDQPLLRVLTVALVVAAVGLGNAAYQSGNVSGAALGLEALGAGDRRLWSVAVGAAAALILGCGGYRWIERMLVALVALMSVVFLVTALQVRPDMESVAAGLTTPRVPPGGLLTVVALVGTTVVPYNLFLHANAVREKWPAALPVTEALKASRIDAGVAIAIGGLVTLAITVTAAAAFFGRETTWSSAATMAAQLEPLLGRGARYCFALGLLAAGLTSAITAPLAAAYATGGVLGWGHDLRDPRLRAVWVAIIVAGTLPASLGTKPVRAIVFAQAANGVLLPVVATVLLIVMNRRALLGEHRNGLIANVLGAVVVIVVLVLGSVQVSRAFGLLDAG